MSQHIVVRALNEYSAKLLEINFNKIQKAFHKKHGGIILHKRESHKVALSHLVEKYQKIANGKLLIGQRKLTDIEIWYPRDGIVETAEKIKQILIKIATDNGWYDDVKWGWEKYYSLIDGEYIPYQLSNYSDFKIDMYY